MFYKNYSLWKGEAIFINKIRKDTLTYNNVTYSNFTIFIGYIISIDRVVEFRPI